MVHPLLKLAHNKTGGQHTIPIAGFRTITITITITITELTGEINKMKTKKSVGYDRISNEMINISPAIVITVLLDFMNLCLNKSLASNSSCNELITPIHKNRSVDDPNNYRDICVSSALTKLLTSMIRARDFDKQNSDWMQEALQNCWSSFNPSILIKKKHVTKGENKRYACFVDLRKAYDSVPHRNLFDQLRKLGLNGKLLDLVENLYKRTKCAVKVNGKITKLFTYTKGVRRGCPLSCLLLIYM